MTTFVAIDGRSSATDSPRSSVRRLAAATATLLLVAATSVDADEPMRVSIYAGSRGTGVPAEAHERLLDVERYLQAEQASSPGAFRFGKSVVGLEGETMLCIEFHDPATREAMLARLQPMVASVPLLSMGRSRCSID